MQVLTYDREKVPDVLYLKTFFYTYQSFSSPDMLLKKLIQKYHVRIEKGVVVDDKFKADVIEPVQTRVCRVLKFWIEQCPWDFNGYEPPISPSLLSCFVMIWFDLNFFYFLLFSFIFFYFLLFSFIFFYFLLFSFIFFYLILFSFIFFYFLLFSFIFFYFLLFSFIFFYFWSFTPRLSTFVNIVIINEMCRPTSDKLLNSLNAFIDGPLSRDGNFTLVKQLRNSITKTMKKVNTWIKQHKSIKKNKTNKTKHRKSSTSPNISFRNILQKVKTSHSPQHSTHPSRRFRATSSPPPSSSRTLTRSRSPASLPSSSSTSSPPSRLTSSSTRAGWTRIPRGLRDWRWSSFALLFLLPSHL